jgi:tetratricopeptide (TPR) repeat protein
VACALLLLEATPARADYRVNYRAGILAIDGQRWAEAVMYLQLALKENSTEGDEDVLIAGSRSEPYLPLYYLGYAYYRMGDCAHATGAWQLAKMNEVVLEYPRLLKTLNSGVAACDTRGGPPPDTPNTRDAEVARLMKQAEADLRARRFKQARDRVHRARVAGAEAATVDEFLGRIATAEVAATSTTPPAPRATAEREALVAFYSGDYARTEQLLAPMFEAGTLTPRGHLYLACSYAASALLRGHEPEARLQRARDIYRQALARKAVFTADWKFISPRLREALEARGPS